MTEKKHCDITLLHCGDKMNGCDVVLYYYDDQMQYCDEKMNFCSGIMRYHNVIIQHRNDSDARTVMAQWCSLMS